MAKKEVWEPCPRCNSNRVESRGGCFYALMGIGLMGISIWLLFIPIIGITGILFGAVLLLASPFSEICFNVKTAISRLSIPIISLFPNNTFLRIIFYSITSATNFRAWRPVLARATVEVFAQLVP